MFPQHVIIDSYSIGSDASRQPLACYLYDDLHPATRYARAIAKVIKSRIGSINPAVYSRVLSSSDVAGGAALSIGDIPAGQHKAVWIKRIVNTGAIAYNNDTATLTVKCDTAA